MPNEIKLEIVEKSTSELKEEKLIMIFYQNPLKMF